MSEGSYRSTIRRSHGVEQNVPNAPLSTILRRIDSLTKEQETISFGNALDAAGQHSFAPILLTIGLIMMAPGPADIPGVPVVLGVLIIIVAAQILIGRKHVWMPQWIERRKIRSKRVHTMIDHVMPWAQRLDRITKPRYSWLLRHAGGGIVAIACILIALTTPLLEFVPMSANVAGAAIATFALAVLSKDGLLAGVAIFFSVAMVALVVWGLFH